MGLFLNGLGYEGFMQQLTKRLSKLSHPFCANMEMEYTYASIVLFSYSLLPPPN